MVLVKDSIFWGLIVASIICGIIGYPGVGLIYALVSVFFL